MTITRKLPLLLVLLAPATVLAAPPLVVIDPGHGGTNVGARSPARGTFEKKLALAVSRQAAKLLRARGKVRARMTRSEDRYLTLQQRVRLANRLGAAAFVSVHLNASVSRSLRGFETYVLSRGAADAEAKRIAMRENGGAGVRRGDRSQDDLAAILTDLSQRAQLERSTRLALAIHQRLRAVRGETLDRGMRQAPFDVLMGLRMPGVLVELGFIDHPVEGPELHRPELQARLAKALAEGIERYLAGGRGPSRLATR